MTLTDGSVAISSVCAQHLGNMWVLTYLKNNYTFSRDDVGEVVSGNQWGEKLEWSLKQFETTSQVILIHSFTTSSIIIPPPQRMQEAS